MEKFFWKDIISMNTYLLKIAGLWPQGYEVYKRDLYWLYSILVICLVTTHILFQTVYIIFVYSDLQALIQTTFVCIAEILGMVKIFIFVKNMTMVKRLMVMLDSDIFQPANLRQKLLVEPSIKVWKMIYHSLLAGVAPSIFLWISAPILSGSVRNYELPFPAWYPYDFKKSYLYELTYLHQVLGSWFLVIGNYNVDMLISALMMYVGAQCDILCDSLRHLRRDSNNFGKMLKRCIIRHRTILRFAVMCNDFLNFIMLGQFFTGSVCVAMALFRLVMVSPSSFEFYFLFGGTQSMILQIFTYCWFGNEVESKSDKIAYAAFESAWIEQCQPHKISLIIFVERALLPIKFSTLKAFYLTLETFVKILRAAVSYYTVLKQLDGRK